MRIFDNPNLNFMKWRWHALILSVLVIGAGFATVDLPRRLPLGVDFSGGTVLQLKFTQPPNQRPSGRPCPAKPWCRPSANAANNEVLVRLPIMKGTNRAPA
jgi:preprotein translocase subunit SecF